MANPSNFTPLITRLNELFISGSGTNPTNDPSVLGTYSIDSGSFDLSFFYDQRQNDGLAIQSLWKPQLNFKIQSIRPTSAWSQNYFEKMYDFTLQIDIGYFTDSKLMKSKRDLILQTITNDVVKIVKTLTFPGNLEQTIDGFETGLCGGCFFENSFNISEFVFDEENSLLKSSLTADAKIVLTN